MIGYFGSVTKKTFSSSNSDQKLDFWSAESSEYVFRLEGANSCTATLERNGVKMLSLGLMHRNGKPFQKDQAVVLAEILDEYEKGGDLNIMGIEGSFTVMLIDTKQDRVFLFRNLVGSDFVYYTQTEKGLFFGNRLAAVARRSGQTLSCDEQHLPHFFIYRFVSGQYTLFRNIFRLQPGELLSWEKDKQNIKRIQSVADLLETSRTDEQESVGRIESTMSEILQDWSELVPNTAVLLSGGVDSTYIQVHWNNRWKETHPLSQKPKSAAVVLDHPYTKGDYDYTMSAVRECNTDHLNVMQPVLSFELMRNVISRTGEMPNHVQSFFFLTLAQGMKKEGIAAGISGEGADGLFGSDGPNMLLLAKQFQKKIPGSAIRSFLATLGDCIKPGNLRSRLLRLANHHRDLNWKCHPINFAGAFCHFPTLHHIFTDEEIAKAFTFRKDMIRDFCVSDDTDHLQWTNLAGYFGEGINTAAYWSQMFTENDILMYSPFQDSRIIRAGCNISNTARFVLGNPKQVLKKALAKHVSEEFVRRPKLSFGQPIFEWLSPGGCLRQAAEQIADYPFMPKKVKQQILEKPNWILWDMLCYDIWHKEFIG